MKVQDVSKAAKTLVKDAGGNVQMVDSDIEILPGRFLEEYEVTMPEGTLELSQKNGITNLPETYYLLPTNEIVVVHNNNLNIVHYALEDAYKAEVRKANA